METNRTLEIIRSEIERLKDENRRIKCQANERYCSGYDDAFYDLVPFLSTLEKSEKPVPNDLEEAAREYAYRGIPDEMKPYVKPVGDEVIKNFIAGAKWDRSQMMQEAVEARVIGLGLGDTPHIVLGFSDEFKKGDKVRVIILPKED